MLRQRKKRVPQQPFGEEVGPPVTATHGENPSGVLCGTPASARSGTWREAQHRKTKRRKSTTERSSEGKGDRRKRSATEAVEIKVTQGATYAEILRKIRRQVNPASIRMEVDKIRRTKTGESS